MEKTKNGFFAKLFIVIACVISSICLTGCLQTSQNITDIAIISTTVPAEIEMGKFNDANILIRVTYEDGTMQNEKVTLDMIDEANKQIINTQIGTYEITIKFRGKETKLTVNIVEKSYTVKFYNADGVMIYREDNVKSGTAANEPNEAARDCDGYTFVSWDRTFTNVTEDIDVYGIYSKVKNTLTNDVLASKLTNAYENMKTTSHSFSETFIDSNDPENCRNLNMYYKYTSANNITAYSYTNQTSFHYDGTRVKCESEGMIAYQSVEYFGTEAELAHFLLTGDSYNTYDVQYYLEKATTTTYSILKIANKGNAYKATIEFTDEEGKQIKCEIVYDDEYVLSISEAATYNGNTQTTNGYCDYVNKDIPAESCPLDFEADRTKIKNLIETLTASNHHLVDNSKTITYDTTTKKYTYNSELIDLLEPLKNTVTTAEFYTYGYDYDDEGYNFNRFYMDLEINENCSVRITFTNSEITNINYNTDTTYFSAQVVLDN